MSFSTRISFKGDHGLAPLRKRITDPKALLNVAGRSGRNVVQKHLRAKNRSSRNRMGGPRTNFYAKAADAVNFRILNDEEVMLSINAIGISLRFHGTAGLPGGRLRPVSARYLTIPATPEAHGKRAREFGDLEFGFAYDPELGRERPALVRDGSQPLTRVAKRGGRAPAAGLPGGDTTGEAVFWLVRSVKQEGDDTVLPTEHDLFERVIADIEEFLGLLDERAA
ncbi:MAG: hypothetical protein K0R17_2238 [Rariglobus sp.]|jgi:hypothetical protein|nr:hypothetical protein [Rariglobus sp.]